MRALKILLALIITTLGFGVLAGCPPTSDDDDSSDPGDPNELCEGANCSNAADCPDDEPEAGDACDFPGNCHYCAPGTPDAFGYTCDGTSFTFVDEFTCE